MPATSVSSRQAAGNPALIRIAIALALPAFGAATVAGTLLGVVLVTLINSVLILIGVPSTWQKVIIGAFILIAGTLFALQRKG